MSRLIVATGCLTLMVTASAQTSRGSLSGIAVYQGSVRVPEAPIQIRHKETGAIERTTSAADGRYRFADIPAGVYELSVAMPCCAYDPFRNLRKYVKVQYDATIEFLASSYPRSPHRPAAES